MTRRAEIICTGIAVMDTILTVDRLPSGDGKVLASALREIGGGPAATAAAAICRLGGNSRLWGRVGDDQPGERIIAELTEYGVRVDGVRTMAGVQSARSSVAVDSAGARQIIAFTDPAMDSAADWLQTRAVAEADCVLCDARWPEGSIATLEAARHHGKPGVLDADMAADGVLERLIGLASHVIFAEPALSRLAGTDDPADGLSRVAGQTGGWLAVTCGARGVWWLEDEAINHMPAHDVTAVDTVGAGDVFHGAFALGLAESGDTSHALRLANASAALKCERPGGRSGIPDRTTVETFLKGESLK